MAYHSDDDMSSIADHEDVNEGSDDESDSGDESMFPDTEADDVIQKYKDDIAGDDWLENYRRLVPLMREDLVGKIVEIVINTQKLKKSKFFRDIVDQQQVHLSNDEMEEEEALYRSVHDNIYLINSMIPYNPANEVKEMFEAERVPDVRRFKNWPRY
jgi:hypothetical protein